MLTPAQIAKMQATQNSNLPNLCTIVRAGATVDDGMGGSTTGTPTRSVVACRIGVAGNAADRDVADKQENINTIPITFPAGTDVTNQDRIETSGRIYEVQSVAAHDYETARQVQVIEIL